MKKPHVHAASIKAWADGETIEMYCHDKTWRTVREPSWYHEALYRAKPDSFVKFKEALAAGERVDARLRSAFNPGCGWEELRPEHDVWDERWEYRVAQPWQDERDAHDRGEKIQLEVGPGNWTDCVRGPWWERVNKYRVKPKTTSHVCEVSALALVAPESVASYSAAPFKPPVIHLTVESTDGIVTNVTLKDWKA